MLPAGNPLQQMAAHQQLAAQQLGGLGGLGQVSLYQAGLSYRMLSFKEEMRLEVKKYLRDWDK
jgi:hypothetical protein